MTDNIDTGTKRQRERKAEKQRRWTRKEKEEKVRGKDGGS